MDKNNHIKFDENGKRIPRISVEEARQKIEQTNLEIIQDNRAQSMAENIAQQCAIIKYQRPDAYDRIKAKMSPELVKMVDERSLVLVPLIESGVFKIDNEEVVKSLGTMIKILEAEI